MQEIVILGAGASGLTLIEEIRAKNISCNITLIDKNNYFFPKKELISNPADLTKRIDLNEWAKEKEVEFISGYVARINPRRRRIYFKEGEFKDFNNLVVASGLNSKKLPIKGEQKDGFFYFSEIDSFKLKDFLKISKEACVYASTWLGLRLAMALANLDKNVRVVSANLDFLGEDREKVVNALGERNIILYLDAFIEEAVGEGMIKAAKLSPLMVFSSQLIFIDSGFTPNLKFFEEGITVENGFFTNFQGVYFLGDINRPGIGSETFLISNHENAKKQARVFADFVATGVKSDFSNQGIIDKDVRVNIEKSQLDPSATP